MKMIFLISVFLSATPSFAQTHDISTSKFYFFKSKCEASSEEGPSVTPQSPPLDVDDPGTPGCNNWEINVLANGEFTKGEQQYELPLLDINYGFGDNFQLKYEVPLEKVQTETESNTHVGRSKVGVKYMFFENEETDTQIGFYPQVDMTTPGVAKDSNSESSASGNVVSLPLLFSTKLGAINTKEIILSANLGYNVSSIPDVENSVFSAVGVGLAVTNKLAVMGEISDEEALTKNSDDVREQLVKANLGLVDTVNKHFAIYGSLGESLVASDRQNHQYVVAGIKFFTGALDK